MAVATVLSAVGLTGRAAQRVTEAPERLPIQFADVTREAGIDFHLRSGDPDKRYLIELTAGGVALVDIDDDGWVDLYFVNGSTLDDVRRGEQRASNRLYRNLGDGTFADVTAQAGVEGRHWGMGVCAGDVNNDGREDLYVTNAGPNLLYVNNGDGTFTERGRASNTDLAAWSSSCAFADADGDGDLDLYVSNYLAHDLSNPPLRTNNGARCTFRGLPGVDVACGPLGLTPAADRYYENLGDETFRDATTAAGMHDVPPAYGMGVVWGDVDDDGDQDLYVANDEMPNFLFLNEGDGRFREVGLPAGVALTVDGRVQGGMGVASGDPDNDGDLDLFVTNFVDDYNTLYQNEGGGAFIDQTAHTSMLAPTLPYVGWGTVFADFDLDGRLDLAVANGHLYPQLDARADEPDTFGETLAGLFDRLRPGTRAPSGRGYVQRNQLFQNLGGARFAEVGEEAGDGFRGGDLGSSRGLAAGDLDNDGLVDLVITHLDDRPSILRNRSAPGNWLLLDLRGRVSNRSAIGAAVVARVGDRHLRRDVHSGGSYQSQHDRRLHFGLGEASRVDELDIRWPSGRTETLHDVEANQILVIEERP